ncbi:MAG TPA: hypothetical protein VN948_04930 [Terriglobales bacterium]|nr:hypothetical protein [Terriglobales bacterium]
MQLGDHGERLFFGRVGDDIVSQRVKEQRPRGQVGTSVALVREGDEGSDGLVNFLAHAVGGIEIVIRNIFPNVVEVCVCLQVEDKMRS